MLTANIVQVAVVALADDRVHGLNAFISLLHQRPSDKGIRRGKRAKRIRQEDWRFDDSQLLNLCRADELAKAIGYVNGRRYFALKDVSAMRQHGSDPRSHVVTLDNRALADA